MGEIITAVRFDANPGIVADVLGWIGLRTLFIPLISHAVNTLISISYI